MTREQASKRVPVGTGALRPSAAGAAVVRGRFARARQRGEQFADRERRLLGPRPLRPREEAFQVVTRVPRTHAILCGPTTFGAGALALLALFAAHGTLAQLALGGSPPLQSGSKMFRVL